MAGPSTFRTGFGKTGSGIAKGLTGSAKGVDAGTLFVRVLPSFTGFNQNLTRQMKGEGTALRAALTKTGATMTALVTGPILAFFTASYAGYAQLRSVQQQVVQELANTGGAAGVTAQHVDELSYSIAKAAGASQAYIESGAKMLLTFTEVRNQGEGANAVFDRAVQVSEDLSVALGTDLTRAATAVGRALTDPAKAANQLRRVNSILAPEVQKQVELLTKQGDKLGAQKLLLDALEKSYGGLAAAAATPTQKLKASFQALFVAFGQYLAPAIDSLINKLTGAIYFFAELPGPVKAGSIALASLLAVVGPVLFLLGTAPTISAKVTEGFLLMQKAFSGIGDALVTGNFSLFLAQIGGRTQRVTLFSSLISGARSFVKELSYVGAELASIFKAFLAGDAAAATYDFFEILSSGARAAFAAIAPLVLELGLLLAIAAIAVGGWQWIHEGADELKAANEEAAKFRQSILDSRVTLLEANAQVRADIEQGPNPISTLESAFGRFVNIGKVISGALNPTQLSDAQEGIKNLSSSYDTLNKEAKEREIALAIATNVRTNSLKNLTAELLDGVISQEEFTASAQGVGATEEEIARILAGDDIQVSLYNLNKTIGSGVRVALNHAKELASGTGASILAVKQTYLDFQSTLKDAVSQNTDQLTEQLGEAATTSEGIQAINASNLELVTGRVKEFIKQQYLAAQQYLDQLKTEVAGQISQISDPFEKLADVTHFTDEKITKAFAKWRNDALQFAHDINGIAKKNPELAKSLLDSGNAALTHYLAQHKEFTDKLGKTYGETQKKIDNASQSIVNKIATPLNEIARILREVAEKKWGINLDFLDKKIHDKVAAIKGGLQDLTARKWQVVIDYKTQGNPPPNKDGGWTGGYWDWQHFMPHLASGGYGDGVALVGERGPELVSLPERSYVHNDMETKKILQRLGAGMGSGEYAITITNWKTGEGRMRRISRDEMDRDQKWRDQ